MDELWCVSQAWSSCASVQARELTDSGFVYHVQLAGFVGQPSLLTCLATAEIFLSCPTADPNGSFPAVEPQLVHCVQQGEACQLIQDAVQNGVEKAVLDLLRVASSLGD